MFLTFFDLYNARNIEFTDLQLFIVDFPSYFFQLKGMQCTLKTHHLEGQTVLLNFYRRSADVFERLMRTIIVCTRKQVNTNTRKVFYQSSRLF